MCCNRDPLFLNIRFLNIQAGCTSFPKEQVSASLTPETVAGACGLLSVVSRPVAVRGLPVSALLALEMIADACGFPTMLTWIWHCLSSFCNGCPPFLSEAHKWNQRVAAQFPLLPSLKCHEQLNIASA